MYRRCPVTSPLAEAPDRSAKRARIAQVRPDVSARMRRVRQRDTSIELRVRSYLHNHGIRFRVCPPGLPGRPDLANRSRGWALFVHGCFWHGHPGCHLARIPRTNPAFWAQKIEANRARDARKERELRELGFDVYVLWQCRMRDPDQLQRSLAPIIHSHPACRRATHRASGR